MSAFGDSYLVTFATLTHLPSDYICSPSCLGIAPTDLVFFRGIRGRLSH